MLQKLKHAEANTFIAYISDISKTSVYDKIKNRVIISNDIQALNMQSIIGTYMKFHIGQPDLVVPMTTLCSEPEFKFENLARTMFDRNIFKNMNVIINIKFNIYIYIYNQ